MISGAQPTTCESTADSSAVVKPRFASTIARNTGTASSDDMEPSESTPTLPLGFARSTTSRLRPTVGRLPPRTFAPGASYAFEVSARVDFCTTGQLASNGSLSRQVNDAESRGIGRADVLCAAASSDVGLTIHGSCGPMRLEVRYSTTGLPMPSDRVLTLEQAFAELEAQPPRPVAGKSSLALAAASGMVAASDTGARLVSSRPALLVRPFGGAVSFGSSACSTIARRETAIPADQEALLREEFGCTKAEAGFLLVSGSVLGFDLITVSRQVIAEVSTEPVIPELNDLTKRVLVAIGSGGGELGKIVSEALQLLDETHIDQTGRE